MSRSAAGAPRALAVLLCILRHDPAVLRRGGLHRDGGPEPGGRRRARHGQRITWGTTNASPTGAPSSCSRCSENRLGTTNASTSDAILGCQAAIPARVGERLGERATAVAQDSGQRAAAVAAGALLAVGEAHPDGAHQPVLVQAQRRPSRRRRVPPPARASRASGGGCGRARSELRCDVPPWRPRRASARRRAPRPRPAAGPTDLESRRQQLGVLAQPLASQPHEV